MEKYMPCYMLSLKEFYENSSHAIFNYSHQKSHKKVYLKSFSYTFVIVRPEARGGVENLCLSVLAIEKAAKLMMKFPDLWEEVVKRIQNLLDKDTEDQLIILNEMDEFRKMISRIVLAYMKIYHYCGYGFIESEISLKVS